MCGIAGMLASDSSATPDGEAVRRMCDAMVHRGPDDHGLRADGPCVLGHRRLSIIDLRPEGAQPMTNEDDTLAVVVNGEIYNFQELRQELEQRGHRFKSRSDSEVVLHAYAEWGSRAVERFNGMFAFAIWDRRRQELFVARDRLGKKPLYYGWFGDTLLFASELRSLLCWPGLEPRIDEDAARGMLQPGDPAPDFSVPDESGNVRTLQEFRGQNVVLWFYPKADTPG